MNMSYVLGRNCILIEHDKNDYYMVMMLMIYDYDDDDDEGY